MLHCAMIIVGLIANLGNVFINRLLTFFPQFFTFICVYNVIFLISSESSRLHTA